ncbi:hypothetical protein ACTFIV_010528 [Dictyostelium citrinum]
MDVMVDI